MNALQHLAVQYVCFLRDILDHVGAFGPAIIALVDAVAYGIPMDPVIVAYAWAGRVHPALVLFSCVSSALASAAGSMVPYWIGYKGGEALLLKRISKERLERVRARFGRHGFWFIVIPCLLPPGTPMKILIIAAGAFGMPPVSFASAIFVGRVVRYGLLALLVVRFGPDLVHRLPYHLPSFFDTMTTRC